MAVSSESISPCEDARVPADTADVAGNPALNLHSHSGLITVYDAATGFPAALLVDNGYISHVRAGVVGALSANFLANTPIDTVGVVGSEKQSFIQLT